MNAHNKEKWYSEEYGFFGDMYIEGDNSKEGYLNDEKLTINERTKKDIDGVVNLLKLNGSEKILDIPCGYGRHSIELAKRDYKVTGVDINSKHLTKAHKNALKKGMQVDFVKSDMTSVDYKNEFDAVINMCYSFGFYDTDDENMKALKQFYKALKSGGKFLVETDVNLPYVRAGKFKEAETRTLFSGNTLKIVEEFNEKTNRMDGSWTIIKPGGESFSRDYSVRVYEKDEFVQMCIDAGFKSCKAYADWNGTDYNKNAQLIIFVAEK